MKLASIVVPVYNIENHIEKCIQSLIDQTYEKLEIILVDDGATDNSGKICDLYAEKDSRIRVLHKVNGGLSDARNKGARECRGEYLFFVDGDDTVSPVLVEKTVKKCEEINGDMVIFDFESIEEETGRKDRYRFQLAEDSAFTLSELPELLLKTPAAWCRMYKRSFWEESGIRYPDKIHYEDLATTPRLIYQANRIGYVGEEPLYHYMLRQGSIMRNNDFERSYTDRTYVLDFVKKYYQEHQADGKYYKELEFIFFEHGYFVPSKEIILEDPESPWLKKFEDYVKMNYPEFLKNPYIAKLSAKDKILLALMKRRMYSVMNILSGVRKEKDLLKQNDRR